MGIGGACRYKGRSYPKLGSDFNHFTHEQSMWLGFYWNNFIVDL